MLNIFHTGGLTLGLSLVFVVLEVIFISQGIKHSKKEGYEWYKSPFIYFAALATLIAFVVAILAVASDYKGV
jgi:hypothetical protein